MNRRALEHMAVDTGHTIAMIDLDTVAEAATPASLDHLARACGINLRSGIIRDIQAIMEHAPRRAPPAKRRCDYATCRPNPARWRRWKIVCFGKRRQRGVRKTQ